MASDNEKHGEQEVQQGHATEGGFGTGLRAQLAKRRNGGDGEAQARGLQLDEALDHEALEDLVVEAHALEHRGVETPLPEALVHLPPAQVVPLELGGRDGHAADRACDRVP